MIIAIPLRPQPVLHSNDGDKTPSWRWAIRNQWLGEGMQSTTNAGSLKIPAVGASWLDGLNPLESGAASIINWAPYQRNWVISVGGNDRIIEKVTIGQLDPTEHADVVVYPDGMPQSTLVHHTVEYWEGEWAWLLQLK